MQLDLKMANAKIKLENLTIHSRSWQVQNYKKLAFAGVNKRLEKQKKIDDKVMLSVSFPYNVGLESVILVTLVRDL